MPLNKVKSIQLKVKSIQLNRSEMQIAFLKLGLSKKHSEELAFHLADMREDFVVANKTILNLCKRKHCTEKEYDRLVYHVGIHMAYHTNEIRKLINRIDKS